MLRTYDIIALNEVKTALPVHLPGYVSYRGKTVGSSDRGGVMVLVRNHLSKLVHNVDLSIGDQVWLQLSTFEDVLKIAWELLVLEGGDDDCDVIKQ